MTAPQRFAKLVIEDPARAVRVANLVAQGHSIARALIIIRIADKENYR